MSAASLNTFTKNLPPEKMALFNALYYSEEKSTSIAYVFLIFLGSIGGQKFYLNNSKKWLYLLFSWTMIPSLIAIFELLISVLSIEIPTAPCIGTSIVVLKTPSFSEI